MSPNTRTWLPLSAEDRSAIATLRSGQYAPQLDDEERDFLDRLSRAGTYTPAQRDWLDRIFYRVVTD